MLNHASGGLRLAIPLYDTLHTVGEAMGPWACALGDVWGQLGRAASNRQPMSVPLSHLRDNARYWTARASENIMRNGR